jgi:hypothetical protein
MRMQQASWSPASSAGSPASSFGSQSTDATAAAPTYQWNKMPAQQSRTQLDSRAANEISSPGSSTAIAAAIRMPETQLPQMHDHSPELTDCRRDTLQRSDSLEDLEASCHGMAGVLQGDTSAADKRAQQLATQAAVRPATAANGQAANVDTAQLSAKHVSETAGTPRPSMAATSSDAGSLYPVYPVYSDRAAEQDVRAGDCRRGTDASVTTEHAMLRQELSHLRSEHVTTRIQCVLLQQSSLCDATACVV